MAQEVAQDRTHGTTAANDTDHLESMNAANFQTGSRAYTKDTDTLWVLDKDSLQPRDVALGILWTKNSYGDDAIPGRWIEECLFCPATGSSTPGPTGPAGATGPEGPTGPPGPLQIPNFNQQLTSDATVTGVPSALTVGPIVTTAPTTAVNVQFSAAGGSADAGPSTLTAQLFLNTNGGGPVLVPGSRGTAATSAATTDRVYAGLNNIVDLPPGSHVFTVNMTGSGGAGFLIPAATGNGHAALSVLVLEE